MCVDVPLWHSLDGIELLSIEKPWIPRGAGGKPWTPTARYAYVCSCFCISLLGTKISKQCVADVRYAKVRTFIEAGKIYLTHAVFFLLFICLTWPAI